jgi:hypothetical protein
MRSPPLPQRARQQQRDDRQPDQRSGEHAKNGPCEGVANRQGREGRGQLETVLDNALFLERNLLEWFIGLVYLIVAGPTSWFAPIPTAAIWCLVPPAWHERIAATLRDAGEKPRLWFGGQLLAMLIVAILFGLGT